MSNFFGSGMFATPILFKMIFIYKNINQKINSLVSPKPLMRNLTLEA
jgi:hypothetical protein